MLELMQVNPAIRSKIRTGLKIPEKFLEDFPVIGPII